MTNKLPPMPEMKFHEDHGPHGNHFSYFTLSQLQADRLAVWNAAIRKAAEVAADEDHEVQGRGHYDQLGDARATQHNIVSAIRLLEEMN